MKLTDGKITGELTMKVWDGKQYRPECSQDIIDYKRYDARAEAFVIGENDWEFLFDYLHDWEQYADEDTIQHGYAFWDVERFYNIKFEPCLCIIDNCGTEIFEEIVESEADADLVWEALTKVDKKRRKAFDLAEVIPVWESESNVFMHNVIGIVKTYK